MFGLRETRHGRYQVISDRFFSQNWAEQIPHSTQYKINLMQMCPIIWINDIVVTHSLIIDEKTRKNFLQQIKPYCLHGSDPLALHPH